MNTPRLSNCGSLNFKYLRRACMKNTLSLLGLSFSLPHFEILQVRKIVLFILCMLLPITASTNASLHLEVTQGNIKPMPLAITHFETSTPQEKEVADKIVKIIKDNLISTGLFLMISSDAFIQTIIPFNVRPRFDDWRKLNAQALVNGKVETLPNGHVKVSFRLWDVLAEQPMANSSLQTTVKYHRRIAHLISDAIYKRITGEDGYFDTRIVYVAERGPQKYRQKRLAIMDQDGENHQYLTDGKYMVLTPRFDQNLQKVAYLSYIGRMPKVFVLDLETGKHELVGHFPGMTFAPRFSPDGSKLVLSQSLKDKTSIYLVDLRTKESRQLTNFPGIDTSPSYSSDGRSIVFNSDRSGTKQLYVMDANGGNIKRISFGKGTYATPVWSPRGDLIAFTKTQGGQFYIGVMKPDGSAERLLSTGFVVESPTWAPNGRTIMFARQEKSTPGKAGIVRLYATDITGNHERAIRIPGDGSDPAWSPLLPLIFK